MKIAEKSFTTISGVPIEPLYGHEDITRTLGAPGEFPYARGIHRDMYRGKLWTMRQFSGFANPEETNRRYHYLLEQGQTGLSVAFDLSNLTDAGQRILKLYLYQTWGKSAKAAEWLSKLQAREEPSKSIAPLTLSTPTARMPPNKRSAATDCCRIVGHSSITRLGKSSGNSPGM